MAIGPWPPFWSEKYENSLPKRVFNNIFAILGGYGPDCGQSRTNFTKINQNFEYFQIILEDFVNEFHQKWFQKALVLLKKAKFCPAAGGFVPRPPTCDSKTCQKLNTSSRLRMHYPPFKIPAYATAGEHPYFQHKVLQTPFISIIQKMLGPTQGWSNNIYMS